VQVSKGPAERGGACWARMLSALVRVTPHWLTTHHTTPHHTSPALPHTRCTHRRWRLSSSSGWRQGGSCRPFARGMCWR
jgi:hypothetical protein